MQIDHIALYVEDLTGVRDFFVTYFGAVPNEGYENPRTGLRTYFLRFDGGARLELMYRPDMLTAEKSPLRTGYAHLALSAGSRERVDELTDCLKRAGYAVLSGPRLTGDGYYESCILGPEDNVIEITL